MRVLSFRLDSNQARPSAGKVCAVDGSELLWGEGVVVGSLVLHLDADCLVWFVASYSRCSVRFKQALPDLSKHSSLEDFRWVKWIRRRHPKGIPQT